MPWQVDDRNAAIDTNRLRDQYYQDELRNSAQGGNRLLDKALQGADFGTSQYNEMANDAKNVAAVYDPRNEAGQNIRQGQQSIYNQLLQAATGGGQTAGQMELQGQMARGENQAKQVAMQAAMSAGASPAAAARAASMSSENYTRGLGSEIAATGMRERLANAQAAGQFGQSEQQAGMQNYLANTQNQMGNVQASKEQDRFNLQQANKNFTDQQSNSVQNAKIEADLKAAEMQASAQKKAAEMQLGGAALGILSDERQKQDIMHKGSKSIVDALSHVTPYEYRYKDQANGEGKRVGVMAQDLERNGLGEPVEDTSKGKMLDYGKTISFLLASTAALADELKKVKK